MEEEQKNVLTRCKYVLDRGKHHVDDIDPSEALSELQSSLQLENPLTCTALLEITQTLLCRKYYHLPYQAHLNVNGFFKFLIENILKSLSKDTCEFVLIIAKILKSHKKFYDDRYTDVPSEIVQEYEESLEKDLGTDNNENFYFPKDSPYNLFYSFNLKLFGRLQGFDKLISLVSEPISFNITIRIIRFIASFNTSMVYSKWKDFAKKLSETLTTKIKNISDDEIRVFTKSEIKKFFHAFEILLQKLYSLTKASERLENCELDLSLRFLTSKYLEKRILGISDIINKVGQARNSIQESVRWLSVKSLLGWIDSHDLIEIIFGPSSHPEIVKRSVDLINFLYMNCRFSRIHIDKLWDCTFLKHETDRDALIHLFSELTYVLKLSDLQYLFYKVLMLNLHEIDGQILSLVKALAVQISKYPNKSDNDTEENKDNSWEGLEESQQKYVNQDHFGCSDVLDFIWKLCQEESINAGVSLAVTVSALDILKESLFYFCRSDRYKFLIKCIENIKKNSAVVTSCKLIEEILNSYNDIRSNYDNESRGVIVKNLEKEHHLISELFSSFLLFKKEAVEKAQILLIGSCDKFEESHSESCYTCSNDDDDSQESESRSQKHSEVFKNLRISKDCTFNYFEELKFRLGFIKYLYVNSAETLSVKHAQILWEASIMNAVNEEEYEIIFNWFSNALNTWFNEGIIINEELTHHIFTDCFIKLDPRFISIEGYFCFEKFFVNLNKQHSLISNDYYHEIEVKDIALLGIQYLWEVLLQARQKKVSKLAMKFLKKIYKGLKQPSEEALNELIRNCMEFISEGSERLRTHTDLDASNQVSRSLGVLIAFLQDFESQTSNDTIEICVKNYIPSTSPKEFFISIHPTTSLGNLRVIISSKISPRLAISELLLFLNSKSLSGKYDSKHISDLGMNSKCCINLYEANRDFDNAEDLNSENLTQLRSIFPGLNEEVLSLALENSHNNLEDTINCLLNEDNVIEFQKRIEKNAEKGNRPKESQKLSEVISNSQQNFSLLFQLFEIGDENINNKVWELLNQVPVNQNMLNTLQNFENTSWMGILSTTCMHKLLYGLKIIHLILSKNDFETHLWKEKFFENGGYGYLYRVLMTSESFELTNSDKHTCLCLDLLIKVVRSFLQEALSCQSVVYVSPSEEISIETFDLSGLMTKMLQIIEFCVNRELEITSLIESALDLTVALILNNTELLSKLYERDSFHCLINYLLESQKASIRQAIKLTILSIVEAIPTAPNGLEDPINFFKKLMLKILPSGHLEICEEYFDLLVKLFKYSPAKDHKLLNVCIEKILKATPIEDKKLGNQDKVLTGYMNLASVLISTDLEGFAKVIEYLCSCLFEIPASSVVPPPKFKHEKTRKAAFNLLIELVRYDFKLRHILLDQINRNHYSPKLLGNFESDLLERCNAGFVGLRNFGATCYMNSLIQQLFSIKSFKEGIQNSLVYLEDPDDPLEDNLLYHLQDLFLNLQESDKKYYEPFGFCKAFKDFDGQPMNLGLQQDVDEFFNIFCDKIEEALKKTAGFKLLKNCFGGVLVHEIESCEADFPYKGEREDQFFRISLDIKNKKTLAEALDLYVKEDILDGDNKYLCEPYNCKITAKMRCLISSLSNTVIIHLKRFEFNYSTMQRIKMNDYCEFPMKLNLRPWCKDTEQNEDYYVYDLVGVLVHSGSADSGHYYSIIKDRASENWLKFDDKHIHSFEISLLKEECFGGENLQNWSEVISFTKTRSAYMLVYERSRPVDVKIEPNPSLCEKNLVDFTESIKSKIKKENHEFLRDKLLFDKAYSEFLQDFFDTIDLNPVTNIDKMLSLTQKISERSLFYHVFQKNPELEKCTSTELFSCPEILDAFVTHKNAFASMLRPYSEGLSLLQTGSLFAFEMLLRGRQNDTFVKWMHKLCPIFENFTPSCVWLLQYLTKNYNIVNEILIEYRDNEVRNEFKNLLTLVIEKLCRVEGDYLTEKVNCVNLKALPYNRDEFNQFCLYTNKYVATLSRFFKVFLGHTMKKVMSGGKSYSEYFYIIKSFTAFNSETLKLLVEFNAISKLFSMFISEYSLIGQSSLISTENENLLEICAYLLLKTATSAMSLSNSFPSYLHNSEKIVQLSHLEEQVFYSSRSIEKLIQLGKHKDCRNILLHLAFENIKTSVEAIEKFVTNLFEVKYDQGRYNNLLKIGYYLLSIHDNIREKRIEAFFEVPAHKSFYIVNSGSFFEAMVKTKVTNNNFYVALLIWWSDLMKFEHVQTVCAKLNEKLKPIINEGYECRYSSSLIYWDYMENMRQLQLEINKAYTKISEIVKNEENEPEECEVVNEEEKNYSEGGDSTDSENSF